MNSGSKIRALANRARGKQQQAVAPEAIDEPSSEPSAGPDQRRRLDRATIDDLILDSTRSTEIVFAMIEIDCLLPDLDLFSDTPPVDTTGVAETTMDAIGDTIAGNIRPDDVVYRTNTNEFGVFLNNVTMDEAATATTRVATAVNALFTSETAETYSVAIGMADSRKNQAASLIDAARLDLRSRQRGDR